MPDYRIAKPSPDYCGAPPPQGRETATCVQLTPRHRTPHRNASGLQWTADYAVAVTVEGRCVCTCGRTSQRFGLVTGQRGWAVDHLKTGDHDSPPAPPTTTQEGTPCP